MSSTDAPSMGVEEEFLLVDSAGDTLSCADEVLDAAGPIGLPAQREVGQAQLELNSPVCHDARDLRRHVLTARATAAAAALSADARLIAAGVQPGGTRFPDLTEHDRYRDLAAHAGPLLTEQLVCGCHIHIGVPDRELGVQVLNHLRPWLPPLLALTANSAIHHGRDTGYASWRAVLQSRWACAGAPPYFTSAAHYDELVTTMVDSGAVLDESAVYWDARLSAHLPTVEIRVADVPATAAETVVLATLVRALVAAAQRLIAEGQAAPLVPEQLLRAATWRAARDGLTGAGIHLPSGRPQPQADLLAELIRYVRPELERFGDLRLTTTLLNRVLAHGNGATQQRHAFSARGTVTDTLAHLERLTIQDLPSPTTPPERPKAVQD
ncbi:glutamate--cysteine ligase [Amycolatopsis magusensis]|uniref:glutamate--cysteine ligase n=1 Tax=Amycolatopsis magusensis TaxID=882444 RepID=UPI00378A0AB2